MLTWFTCWTGVNGPGVWRVITERIRKYISHSSLLKRFCVLVSMDRGNAAAIWTSNSNTKHLTWFPLLLLQSPTEAWEWDTPRLGAFWERFRFYLELCFNKLCFLVPHPFYVNLWNFSPNETWKGCIIFPFYPAMYLILPNFVCFGTHSYVYMLSSLKYDIIMTRFAIWVILAWGYNYSLCCENIRIKN